ncbi:TonB-dependent receptor plug domain-containing protein [Aureibacter tunicatorum]|uniref:Iron complex outermembrane receptor protein n=1 Tax=Aureibacter tunicatorum TaxID=866807 RepID=A0AAE3XSJ1_9BACT|nr:TonB-dependent receptor [Aureibacter tunicatorum]MDR6241229.1 iron complex outermembrane receptor protein [Aureibacter tunicatorum]BDD03489.1 TonB-dependent receptor [Aureibacter tunicatorum]
MKLYFLTILACVVSWSAYAQDADDEYKTYNLEEVVLERRFVDSFTTNYNKHKVDSVRKSANAFEPLGRFLQKNTPVYIKESGYGQLATISVRGTKPEHVAITWEGINLNSLTLGHANANNIPFYLFEDAEVTLGAMSSVAGSDAISGVISLSSDVDKPWQSYTTGDVTQTLGFYEGQGKLDHSFTGFKLKKGGKRIKSYTAMYFNDIKNEYEFENIAKYEAPSEVLENAQVRNFGLLQSFDYKLSDKTMLGLKGLWNHAWHEIQPVMGNNGNADTYEQMLNEYKVLLLRGKHKSEWGSVNASIAYIDDFQDYNKGSIIRTKRFQSDLEYFHSLTEKLDVRFGGNFAHIKPEVHAYEDGLNENRGNVFASLKYLPVRRLDLTFNARQNFTTGVNAPFTPSLSVSYDVFLREFHKVRLTSSVSKGYRVPTFNDRYWGTQGNPNLLPEESVNFEAGIAYNHKVEDRSFDFSTNFFQSSITNMIAWMESQNENGNIDWYPENIGEVSNVGVEIMAKFSKSLGLLKVEATAAYTFNETLDMQQFGNGGSDNPNYKKQLPYTPQHKQNAFLQLYWGEKISFGLEQVYVGERSERDADRMLESYNLVNASFSYTFNLGANFLIAQMRVDNLTDKFYQDQKYYAMPGRKLLLNIIYKY